MTAQPDFDVDALYAALDAKRQSLGLSWQQMTREINRLFENAPARPISASTITGMRAKSAIDGDGVLQMLRWLQRTPESFIPGHQETAQGDGALPHVEPHRIVRFDSQALYAALDAQRAARGMTWAQVAKEIGGGGPAGLTRLAKPGGRVGFPHVMRITRWLGRPAAGFTRLSDT